MVTAAQYDIQMDSLYYRCLQCISLFSSLYDTFLKKLRMSVNTKDVIMNPKKCMCIVWWMCVRIEELKQLLLLNIMYEYACAKIKKVYSIYYGNKGVLFSV
jgi:hypothetical protein